MTERVVLHVGLPKCGSSALQTRLATNRDRALAGGVFYPEPAHAPSSWLSTGATLPMSHMLMGKQLVERSRRDAEPGPTLLDDYVRRFRDLAAPTLALSAESLAKQLGATRPALLSPLSGFAAEVLLLTRRADALLLSSYKQAVRNRRYVGSFRAYSARPEEPQDGLRDIAALLDAIRTRLPAARFHVVDLDAPGRARDSIAVGAEILGLPLDEWETRELGSRDRALAARGLPVHTSHSDEKTLYLLALNRTPLEESARIAVDVALCALPDDPIGEGAIMNRHDSRRLLARSAELNVGLPTRYAIPLAEHEVDLTLPRGPRREALTHKETGTITKRVLPLLAEAHRAALTAALA